MSELIEAAERRTSGYIRQFIDACRPLESIAYTRKVGKVRDIYFVEDLIIIVSTDRQSAFDRHLAAVPFKGQVLNCVSNWWFERTKSIVPNHIIANPHPNIVVCKRCSVFPVEFVVRGYITGSTSTSMWTNYAKGVRDYCGHQLPEGLKKNQKLDVALLTPTTKDDAHDELICAEEVVRSGRMTDKEWEMCSAFALRLFAFSQAEALSHGLILVDTKYEFGRDESSGKILLVDELQTPDSSRYWIAASYEDRMAGGEEPENIDKEFIRRWFVEHCDPYRDAILPEPPVDLINELSRRYIFLQEIITGEAVSAQAYESLSKEMDAAVERFILSRHS